MVIKEKKLQIRRIRHERFRKLRCEVLCRFILFSVGRTTTTVSIECFNTLVPLYSTSHGQARENSSSDEKTKGRGNHNSDRGRSLARRCEIGHRAKKLGPSAYWIETRWMDIKSSFFTLKCGGNECSISCSACLSVWRIESFNHLFTESSKFKSRRFERHSQSLLEFVRAGKHSSFQSDSRRNRSIWVKNLNFVVTKLSVFRARILDSKDEQRKNVRH